MPENRRINMVHRSLSRPLTILGAERKLFFFAMCIGAGTFNLLGSLLGGLLMFLLLYFVARWATRDRSADSPISAHITQTSQPIRPGKTQPGFDSQAHRCLGSSASLRITEKQAHSMSK